VSIRGFLGFFDYVCKTCNTLGIKKFSLAVRLGLEKYFLVGLVNSRVQS
jgi:hypothetical protein